MLRVPSRLPPLKLKNCSTTCNSFFAKYSFSKHSTSTFVNPSKMVGEDQKHLERTKEATRQPTKVPATIKQIKQETPTVKSFDLEIDPKENLSFHAGQWVDFFIPGEKVVGGFFHHFHASPTANSSETSTCRQI
eukprot:TRINITY_DN2310_c0_g1_i1.p1 TRINITY_DN2310_c0_g1~~TRINITY_DN2310_c0_g1_i1.p1  ORF type:complete len:134 (-),score=26.09 TRINITY_DN2310_c0_g1_i1:779-1180(-)